VRIITNRNRGHNIQRGSLYGSVDCADELDVLRDVVAGICFPCTPISGSFHPIFRVF
jgi:hypothetical protein